MLNKEASVLAVSKKRLIRAYNELLDAEEEIESCGLKEARIICKHALEHIDDLVCLVANTLDKEPVTSEAVGDMCEQISVSGPTPTEACIAIAAAVAGKPFPLPPEILPAIDKCLLAIASKKKST